MSLIADILGLAASHKYTFFAGTLLVALCAATLVWYEPRYDYPALVHKEQEANIQILGRSGTLRITCECPPYLIAQRSRTVTFSAKVKVEKEPKEGVVQAPFKSNETVELLAVAQGAGISDQWNLLDTASGLASKLTAEGSMSLGLRPSNTDFSEVSFVLEDYLENEGLREKATTIQWPLPTRLPLLRVIEPLMFAVVILALALVFFYWTERRYRLLKDEEEVRLRAAIAKVEQFPKQASPAWELAGANLQSYFSGNIAQVRQVFYVAVGSMLVGFAFVLFGVYEQIGFAQADPKSIAPPAWIASIAGVITEFVGATFMVIYRSTMTQATEFVSVLNRINTAGIALKVLDQIPEEDPHKNPAREQLINLLLASKSTLTGRPSESPEKG